MEPTVRLTGKTRTAFYTRDEADAVQRSRTSVIVSRESTNAGFTLRSCRYRVRSPFRDRSPRDVHRFALSPSFAASAARTTSFRLGRHHPLLRDERTVAMFPTDDCFLTLRRRALAPRPFPYAFHRTEPLTLSRRRWRFGGMSQECAGSSHPLIVHFDSKCRTSRRSEPLTPLSLPSIRGVALGAQSRARRRLPRPLLPPARETQAAFTIRGAFPRSVTQHAPSGPRFRDGRSRPAPRRSHDFAAVVRRIVTSLRTPASRRRLSPCEDAHREETNALRGTSHRVSTLRGSRARSPVTPWHQLC